MNQKVKNYYFFLNLFYLDNKSLYENLQLLQVSVEKMYFFMLGHKQQIAFSICMATALHSYPWANIIYALSSLTCGLYLHPLTVTGAAASDSVLGKWH